VNTFWEGPFEKEFFIKSSYTFRQVKEMFVCPEEFLDYKKKSKYKFSIECLFKKDQSSDCENNQNIKAPKHGHLFTMMVWDKSIKSK